MALLHYTQDYNLSEDQTKDLIQSSGIYSFIKSEYKNIARGIDHNPLGMVKLLVASGTMQRQSDKCSFKISGKYECGSQSAWSQFKIEVKAYLKKIINNACLEDETNKVANDICDYWYGKSPTWPKLGCYGPKYYKELDKKAVISAWNDVYIYYIEGGIWMQTRTTGTYGNESYCADIWGNPPVKIACVKLSKSKLRALNCQELSHIKEMADKAKPGKIKKIALSFRYLDWN
mmetsp:Transcript_78193/g.95735  ORF Transcript_78193/g.95735 Transcript_78193/m.95735 type:complete len:232 (+) Transcript_78193:92-787(+)